MPTQAAIRTAIAGVIDAVADTGVVHQFERYAKTAGELKTLYLTGDKLLGWHIRLVTRRRKQPGLGRWIVTITWRLTAYQSFEDSSQSELAFDAMVEAVDRAFRDDVSLGGVLNMGTVIDEQDDLQGMQVDDTGPVLFCGVLCHSARCTLMTKHTE